MSFVFDGVIHDTHDCSRGGVRLLERTMSESPKADRATLDKLSKLLPLLNSANPGEAQAAAAALAKYDLRDVAASLRQEQMPSWRADGWYAKYEAEQKRARQLRLERLQKLAQALLNENSSLLTKVQRKSLQKVVHLTLPAGERHARADLKRWSQRLSEISWQITPNAKELENALSVVKKHVQEVFDPKHRATVVNAIGIAEAALAKAVEELRQMEAAS